MTMDVPVIDLSEHTGYMLRKFYREYFVDIENWLEEIEDAD